MGGSSSKINALKAEMVQVRTAIQDLQEKRTHLEKKTEKLQKDLQQQQQVTLRLKACTKDNSKAIENLDHEMECLDIWSKN